MSAEIKKVAIPAVLRKGLECYRINETKGHRYVLRVPWAKETIEFEPWQIFILEVLPGCNDLASLFSVFEDRFGRKITKQEVEGLFAFVEEKKLFGISAGQIPILAAINDWKTACVGHHMKQVVAGDPVATEMGKITAATNGSTKGDAAGDAAQEKVTTGVLGTTDTEDSKKSKGFKVFNPRWLLNLLLPLLRPFRHVVYMVPLLAASAFLLGHHHFTSLQADYVRLISGNSLLIHIFLGLVVDNVWARLVTALVAYNFRAPIDGIYLVFYLYFMPRFSIQLGNVEHLKRGELIWIHLSPLLFRLSLVSMGVFIWYFAHDRYEFLTFFGLAIMTAGAFSFFLTANPLVKSHGYYILSASINEPKLREKAFAALIGLFRRRQYQQTDPNLLVAYCLASSTFMVLVIAFFLSLLSGYLKATLGTVSIVIIISIAVLLIWRTRSKFKQIGDAYERSLQFEKWRNRTIAQSSNETETIDNKNPSSRVAVYCRRCLLVIAIACLFLPYDYEIGGNVTILPNTQQELALDVEGIVETINFDGGETVPKGAMVGALANSELRAEEKFYDAKIAEQLAVIDELKNLPRVEDINLAKSELDTQITRTKFSLAKANRLAKLYKRGTINFEELDDARRIYEVDKQQTEERRNNLLKIIAGATPEQIAAAEAQLKAYEEKRDFYREQIKRTVFYMPFDGKIITENLKNKLGSYLKIGTPLARVQETKKVKAEIQIPESDFHYIEKGASVRMRLSGYFDQEIRGEVTSFDENIINVSNRKIVKIVTLIENDKDQLKAGMTGYGKVYANRMRVGQVVSLPFVRFFRVEVWSWLP